MKFQDIFFIVIFLFLVFRRSPKLCAAVGSICLFVSIPLFAFWVFFTAQRLVYYGGAFYLLGTVFSLPIFDRTRYNKKKK